MICIMARPGPLLRRSLIIRRRCSRCRTPLRYSPPPRSVALLLRPQQRLNVLFNPLALRADSDARALPRAPALVPDDDSASHVNNTARPEFSGDLIVFNRKNPAAETMGPMLASACIPLQARGMTADFSLGFGIKILLDAVGYLSNWGVNSSFVTIGKMTRNVCNGASWSTELAFSCAPLMQRMAGRSDICLR